MDRASEKAIRNITVAHGALDQLPAILAAVGAEPPVLLVADRNTYKAAGQRAGSLLTASGVDVKSCILERKAALVADEEALAEVTARASDGVGFLLAVGSGTMNDITRYVACKLGIPYAVVATAPSMDGYASTVAALTIKGCKRTFEAVPPIAIVGDVDVLEAAPKKMILAGFGDILGKYTSLADWKISSIVTGEAYSQEVADMVLGAVSECVRIAESAAGGGRGAGEAAESIMNALVTSGLAMLKWGNSRPASGAEHHLAHYWEMRFGLMKKEGPLHGEKVGVAVPMVAGLYHKLFTMTFEEAGEAIRQARPELPDQYAKRVKRAYGSLADEILADLGGVYLDADARAERQSRILGCWSEMREWVMENVPSHERLKEILKRLGAPAEPWELGISREMVDDGLRSAKEVRARYTVFRLAEDILGS